MTGRKGSKNEGRTTVAVRRVGSLFCVVLAFLVLPLDLHADVLDGVVAVHLHELDDWRYTNVSGHNIGRYGASVGVLFARTALC